MSPPSARQVALAQLAVIHPGGAPYAKPGNVRAPRQRCRSCGDVLLPSYIAMWRKETRVSLDVPPICWECIERGR